MAAGLTGVVIPVVSPLADLPLGPDFSAADALPHLFGELDGDPAPPAADVELLKCGGMAVACGPLFSTMHLVVFRAEHREGMKRNDRASRLSGKEIRGPALCVRKGDGWASAFARDVVACLSITG